ncbi:MAG: phenylalanine--tRNA ligase subunit alpha, partial [Spartobacteria bacterium]
MQQQVDALRSEAIELIASAHDAASLEAARLKYLGKSGAITALSEGMRNVPKEERPVVGKLLNDLRSAVTAALEDSQKRLLEAADLAAFASLDLTLPGTFPSPGTLHPLTQLMDRAVRCFRRMGFAIADGPDIETEWHCFDALNTPPDHPARNEQDTFYLHDGRLLRSHTSSVQIRVMETTPPPVRI